MLPMQSRKWKNLRRNQEKGLGLLFRLGVMHFIEIPRKDDF